MEGSYLFQLAVSLANGVGRLPADVRTRYARFLCAQQNDDGGFPGREGGSDLYYTGFGLRGLAVLDAMSEEVCQRAAKFLRASLTCQATVVDVFSLLYAAALIQVSGGPDVFADAPAGWNDRVAGMLETFRTSDGGYANRSLTVDRGPLADKTTDHGPQSTDHGPRSTGSTYHTFLVALCYQLLGRTLPEPEQAARFVQSRRREDGGFVEFAPMRRSGTNPTAAAVGVLQMIGDSRENGSALVAPVRDGIVEFLQQMPSLEGGFRANARAPLADLLSTFTGLLTLRQLQALDRVDMAAVLRYIEQLEFPGGGFRGGLWDEQTDVEYTFYGLGCFGIVASSQ